MFPRAPARFLRSVPRAGEEHSGRDAAYVARASLATPEPRLREPGARYAGRRARVLLVEDDPLLRRSVTRLLALAFEVTAVGSAEEALLCFRPGAFDIVATDQRMASMTGLELLEQIRTREPRVRRVLVSGVMLPGLAGYLGSGVVERFLLKPVDLRAALLELLAEAGESA